MPSVPIIPAPASRSPHPGNRRHHRTCPPFLRATCLFLLLLGACLTPSLKALAAGSPSATRVLPAFFEDLVPVSVLIEVSPPDSSGIHALEEEVPDGWTVSGINYGGVHNPASHKVRWGPFPDNLPRTLTYQLTPPLDAAVRVGFHGTAVFDTEPIEITGPAVLDKRPGRVERGVPTQFIPGQSVTITLAVRPGASALAWALQESIPPDWVPSPVPADASFDPVTRSLKWGPFLDPAPRDLSYTLQPSLDTRAPALLSGVALFEGIAVPVSGPSTIPIQPSRLTRLAPIPFTPGTSSRLEIRAEPAPYVEAYSVEEDVPPGLLAHTVSHNGAWDAVHRRVKWGPFTDATPRLLSFQITTPLEPAHLYPLSGRGRFDTSPTATEGPASWPAANAPAPSSLVVDLPGEFDPGTPFEGTLHSQPAVDVRVHALELALPADWEFVDATHDGFFDPIRHRIKWGPFQDATPRILRAGLRSSPSARTLVELPAEGWFDDARVPASGNTTTRPTPSTAVRTLPARFTPGVAYTVHIQVTPSPTLNVVSIQDAVPPDAQVAAISEGGTYDPVHATVKWGPFPDALRRTLTYQVTPSVSARQNARFSGLAVFDSAEVPVTGSSLVVLNHDPVAQPDLLQRPPLPSAKFSVVELLANDGDLDGDALRVRSVGGTTAAGASVVLLGPWIYYDAPNGPPAEDQFSYTLEDAFGSRAVSSVTVLFSSAPVSSRLAIVSVTPEPGGRARIRFMALPGITCRIEVSPDLRHWSFLAEGTTGPSGFGEVLDTEAHATPIRFYRVTVR